MKLLELFSKNTKKIIKEGGNITLPTGETPDDLDLTVTKRGYIVPILDKLLADIDRLYQAQHKETLWSPKLLSSKKFLSGSSLHFFNLTGIPDEQFVKVKPKIGDIDTQIDVEKTDKLKAFLDSIQGQDLGDAKLLGYKSGNQQFSSLWELKEPPIKIQIDLEFVDYEKDEPTEWSQFSHSSAWEDVQEGIKGVFHKFLISSIGSLSKKDFLLRKLVGRGKARAEQDVPTTDNMLSFAVSSKEGGGLRPKYAPVLGDDGQPLFKDGLPVMTALPTSGYEKNILTIFQTLFGDRVGAKELSAMKNKLWSFVGLLDVMNMILDDQEKRRVFDSFVEKLFGKGAQGLYKNDPKRDSADKNSALNKIAQSLGIQMPAEVEQMKNDYYAAYKMTGESITEAEAPSYKRQGIKHIYNPGSSTEISDRDFLTLVRKIQSDLGGQLQGAKVNLKVDGAGIRFGKDEAGRPFMMTSRADKPLYADDIGSFAAFNKDRPEEFQQRAAKYDRALDIIVNSDFIKALPKDTIVQAEMLYNEMAEKTDGGLKFVNIPYDAKKLGGKMTLVPFMAKIYSTGESHPQEEEILENLTAASTKDIKIMSNTLPSRDIDVSRIIEPAVNLSPELEATLAPRTKDTPEKQQAKEILAGVKKELSDFIIDNPNISGKDQLGPNIEGLVIDLPGLPPVKVTSQTMKAAMAAKKAPPPGAENQPTKTAVVALGSFVGHRGHQQLFDFVKQEAQVQGGDPYVFISQAVGKDDPIPGDMKLATWQKLYPNQADVFSLVQDQPDGSRGSLMKKVEHELVKPRPGKLPDYNNIIIMVGSDRGGMEKQAAHLQNRLNKFPGYENVRISLKTTPREAGAGGTGVNFTAMRNVLKDPNASEEQQLQTWMQGFDGKTLGAEWIKKLMAVSRQNMGLTSTENNTESLGEVYDQLCRQYFTESISLDSAVRGILSTGDSIAKTYGDLKTMAEKWVYNNGSLKGFHRNAAGVGKRWYDTFFWNKMENDLRTLLQKNPKAAAKIQDFLNIERDDKGHVSFTVIGRSLPRILNDVGEKMGDDDLKRFGANWFKRQKDYEDYLGRVEAEVNDEDDDEFSPAPKQPKDNVVGRQNAAAEDMVNQILRSIDKKAAGEIRNAIAREPNKLQALQRELEKRNIKVGESLEEDWRKKLAALGMAGMMGASGASGAADTAKTDPIVATIVIDGETKRLDLTPKGFTDVRDAEKWLDKFLSDRGISNWQGKIERGEPGSGRYQRVRISGFVDVNEGKFRARDIEEKLIPDDKLNDLKSRYLPDWEMLDHRILQAKYVAKDHRHAEDFVSYINKVSEEMDHFAEVTQDVSEVTVKTTTFDVKGLTILDFKLALKIDKFAEQDDIEQVRMQGNFGMHESIQEAPIEMDPSDPMDPMIYGHDKANPGKLKYRMARAAGQLKDLAARVDGASPEEWKRMAQQFEELKMNMEQIRHALEELGKVRKKGGIRSRGITV